MNIALKEASETLYWLNLLKDTDYLSETEHASLYADAEELMKIIVAIIKTMKTNNSQFSIFNYELNMMRN